MDLLKELIPAEVRLCPERKRNTILPQRGYTAQVRHSKPLQHKFTTVSRPEESERRKLLVNGRRFPVYGVIVYRVASTVIYKVVLSKVTGCILGFITMSAICL